MDLNRRALVRGALFASQFALFDVVAKGARAVLHVRWGWAGAAASVVLWGMVFGLRRSRAVRLIAALVLAVGLAGDALVALYYGTPFDRQIAASALSAWVDVKPVAIRLLPALIALAALFLAVEWYLLTPQGPALRQSRIAPLALLPPLAIAFLPASSLTPELRAGLAAGILWEAPARVARLAERLPPLPARLPGTPPDVLVVLTESVRASSYCKGRDAPCPFAPETSALFPDRIAFDQVRSVASYTVLSVSAVFTGRTQTDPRDEVARAPFLFDYAAAARLERGQRYLTGYWSAQAAEVWERSPVADVVVTLETLTGRSYGDEDDAVEHDIDETLRRRFVHDIAGVRRPFVGVLHLLGTHAPYFVDPERAPFQPAEHVVSWEGMGALKNAYEDSVVAQDHRLAGALSAFLAAERGREWIVVFTSDHGEAFGEHGAIHHGQNLYDEQIHVPLWIAASPGAISPGRRAALEQSHTAFVTHLDILPTLLDAIGVWDALPLAPFRAKMRGRSLLSPLAPMPVIPISNCTARFPCPLNTWGVMQAGLELTAQPWDSTWKCLDLAREAEVPSERCASLAAASRGLFERLPSGEDNR